MNHELKNILEAVLMVSDTPLSVAKMQGLFEDEVQPETEEIKKAIESLQEDCAQRGVELKRVGTGYRYQSKVKYADWIRKLYATRPPKMSRALLETLAIIAYRQPVTRGDIEEIRGVSVSADIIHKLQERGWVKQIGVRDLPGRPGLFGTTPEFLGYFNLESLKELPSLMEERGLGEIARELETPLPPEVLAALERKEEENAFAGLPIDAVVDRESDSPDTSEADSQNGDDSSSENEESIGNSGGDSGDHEGPEVSLEAEVLLREHDGVHFNSSQTEDVDDPDTPDNLAADSPNLADDAGSVDSEKTENALSDSSDALGDGLSDEVNSASPKSGMKY